MMEQNTRTKVKRAPTQRQHKCKKFAIIAITDAVLQRSDEALSAEVVESSVQVRGICGEENVNSARDAIRLQ